MIVPLIGARFRRMFLGWMSGGLRLAAQFLIGLRGIARCSCWRGRVRRLRDLRRAGRMRSACCGGTRRRACTDDTRAGESSRP
jgi:hypothetical protein